MGHGWVFGRHSMEWFLVAWAVKRPERVFKVDLSTFGKMSKRLLQEAGTGISQRPKKIFKASGRRGTPPGSQTVTALPGPYPVTQTEPPYVPVFARIGFSAAFHNNASCSFFPACPSQGAFPIIHPTAT